MKLKQLFCKHDFKHRWEYKEDFKYNKFFKTVATVRTEQLVCSKCGEIRDILKQWISIDQIKEEVLNKEGITNIEDL